MTVSEIRTRGDRAEVLFEDGTKLQSTKKTTLDFGLAKGSKLTDSEYAALCAASSKALARLRAMQLISLRDMSAKEMRRKLMEKGTCEQDAGDAAEWLQSLGYIDDARYAGLVVRHYAAKGYGASRIRAELSRRGVARELWGEALAELPEQSSAPLEFLRRRLRGGADEKDIKRAADALCRRGYSWEEIRSALECYRAELEE